MSPNQPDPIWNPDDHLDRVYRRGRQLRRRRLVGAGGAAAVVAVTLLALAVSGNLTNTNNDRRVLTAGQSDLTTTTAPAPTETTTPAVTATTGTTAPPVIGTAPTTVKPTVTTTHTPQQPATTTGSAGTVRVTDANKGGTVPAARGNTIVVVLNGTQWTFPTKPDGAVLQQIGNPVTSAGSCPPGVGCGTTTATYLVVGAGHAQITAVRTSCGEVIVCTADKTSYTVLITVPA